jgi:nitrous oxide reductase accessory protein NosL
MEVFMKLGLLPIVLFVSMLLAACDQQPPKAPPVPHVDDAKPVGLFQDQRNALDKAKGVGAQVEDQAQRQRETADQEGK